MSRSTRLYGSDVAVGVCSPRFPSPARRARPAFYWNSATIIVFSRKEGSEVGTGARGVLTPVKLPQRETTSTAQQSILIHANCIEVVITEIEPGRVKEIIFTCEHFMESKIFD